MKNAPGTPTAYQDVGTSGLVRGTGIESQNLAGMADRMVRHMLANPVRADAATPPRVIIDSAREEGKELV